MLYLFIGIYIIAAILVASGGYLYYDIKKKESFGPSVLADISEVTKAGFGIFKKYSAVVSYKIDRKRYKGKIMTSFYQPLEKGRKVRILYKSMNPEKIVTRGNDAYRLFFIVAAVLILLANFIPV